MEAAFALAPAQGLDLDKKTNKSRSGRRKSCPRAFVWNGIEHRCGRRTCEVCGPRRARETGRMLVIDAQDDPPTHVVTLTTHAPDTSGEVFRRGHERVWGRLRRHMPRADYFTRIEFTTGKGRRSGGHRRIHSHSAAKLDTSMTCAELEGLVRDSWSHVTGAWIIGVQELKTPAGALHYLSLHHAKAEQVPPDWWTGRTERASRGYWSSPAATLRARAKAELWAERLAYSTGLTVDDATLLVAGELEVRELTREARAAARAAEPWTPLEVEDDWTQTEIPF